MSGHQGFWVWSVTFRNSLGVFVKNVVATDVLVAVHAIGAWIKKDCEACPEMGREFNVVKIERVCRIDWPNPKDVAACPEMGREDVA